MSWEQAEIATRALHDAASLTLFGAALFALYARRDARRLLLGLAPISLATAVPALASVTATVVTGAGLDPAQIGAVLFDTGFGRVWLARCALALLTVALTILPRQRTGWITLFSGCELAALTLTDHAAARGGFLGSAIVAAHVLAGGAWLGGLAVLMLAKLGEDDVVRRFSQLGYGAASLAPVAGLCALALITGSPAPNLGAFYGGLAAVKLGLFVVLLALAAFNRLVAAPRAHWRLLKSAIVAELAVMAALIGVAATLSASAPQT